MASWFWLNVPLMAVFFLLTGGIPLWLVLRRPTRSGGEKQASAACKSGTNLAEHALPRRGFQFTH